jgi:replicative DNA helicase
MNKEEISTGYNNLDAAWGYLKKSQLVLVAARPGMGKTTLVLQTAINCAIQAPLFLHRHPCCE